jgi:hypothetical protein
MMAGHRRFDELRVQMPAERRARNIAATETLLAEMPRRDLRRARELTNEALADILEMGPSEVVGIEKHADLYVSTLRRFIEAMGGQLEITAHFVGGAARITQFREIELPEVTDDA